MKRGDKMSEYKCYTCIFGIMNYGLSCTNAIVQSLEHPPDKYECEFYEEISDSYSDDVRKIWELEDDV